MPFLHLDGLAKRFGTTAVLADFSLTVERGEILALLGPSGSGKTTALRLVAGFETPDAGRIVVAGDDVTALAPARRRFGMVFQHYALFPHLDVGDNVAFGLAELPAAERGARVAETLALVGLAGLERRRVDQISGGQQQRVALARALAPEPRVLLLDEPMSNLDPTLRERTRRELQATLRRIGITTLLVTHEQEEAFALGDRVAVLQAGHLQQVAAPRELYTRPATRFVATFVGRASVLGGEATDAGGAPLTVTLPRGDGTTVAWPAARPPGELAPSSHAAVDLRAVDLVLRPESLELAPAASALTLPATVLEARFLGTGTLLVVQLAGAAGAGTLEVLAAPDVAAAVGDQVYVQPRLQGLLPFAFPRS
jgi:putative spermidine/putrescine transport system ATP-binding protein